MNGLSGENKRWSETIRRLEANEGMLVGDVLLAAAFVSYAGPFNMAFRQQLVVERWLPDIVARGIPISAGARALLWGLEGHGAPAAPALLAPPWTCPQHPPLPPPRPAAAARQASSRWTC